MLTVKDVVKVIEDFAPLSIQADYDNSGLLFGNPNLEVRGILITLDNSPEIVEEAVKRGCNMIIEHHPSVFNAIKKIDWNLPKHRALALAIKHDVAIYSAHTTVDFTFGGLNDTVAKKLGLTDIVTLGDEPSGARIGNLTDPVDLEALSLKVSDVFSDKHVYYVGAPNAKIKRVAVVNGAGGGSESLLLSVKDAGADVFISSEYKYNVIRLAKDLGYAIISFGHYDSEKPFCDLIKSVLSQHNIDCAYVAETSTNPVN